MFTPTPRKSTPPRAWLPATVTSVRAGGACPDVHPGALPPGQGRVVDHVDVGHDEFGDGVDVGDADSLAEGEVAEVVADDDVHHGEVAAEAHDAGPVGGVAVLHGEGADLDAGAAHVLEEDDVAGAAPVDHGAVPGLAFQGHGLLRDGDVLQVGAVPDADPVAVGPRVDRRLDGGVVVGHRGVVDGAVAVQIGPVAADDDDVGVATGVAVVAVAGRPEVGRGAVAGARGASRVVPPPIAVGVGVPVLEDEAVVEQAVVVVVGAVAHLGGGRGDGGVGVVAVVPAGT
jgi:hypothetical protein